jgi:hypothetical protein
MKDIAILAGFISHGKLLWNIFERYDGLMTIQIFHSGKWDLSG